MMLEGFSSPPWEKVEAAQAAVRTHYRSRGVTDERKLDQLWQRWRRTKGLRHPHQKPARLADVTAGRINISDLLKHLLSESCPTSKPPGTRSAR